MRITTRSEIRVVCFDLGGVVVRVCRSWEEACTRAGLPVRNGHQENPNPVDRQGRKLIDLYQLGRIDSHSYFAGLAESTGGLYSSTEIELIHHAWLLGDYPGMAELIDELNQRTNLTTACLSNTNASHWERLLRTNGSNSSASPAVSRLANHFVSHVIGFVKPDAAAFRVVESTMEVTPESILFFDDLAENVQAAKNCGWNAEWIDPSGDTAEQVVRRLQVHSVF